jgi:hypothetical protein
MIKHVNMLEALTLDGSADPGEKTFDADVAAPTAVTDPNVWDISKFLADGSTLLEVFDTWQFKGRISGTSTADAEIDCVLYCWDVTAEVFYPLATIKFVGVNGLSSTQGNVMDMVGVKGTTYVGLSVSGLTGDHELHVIHRHG